MNGKRLIHRLIWIEVLCFALLAIFISVDDEYLLPKLMAATGPISRTAMAGFLDTIWVLFLFALALYIQIKTLQKIRMLEGMLSVCANCKRIRDGKNHWTPIEDYIHQRTHADFSHTICPDCGVKLYGDVYLKSVSRGDDTGGPEGSQGSNPG